VSICGGDVVAGVDVVAGFGFAVCPGRKMLSKTEMSGSMPIRHGCLRDSAGRFRGRYAASGHRLLGERITPHEAKVMLRRWTLGPVLYLLAAAIGLFSAVGSLAFYVFLLVCYFFDVRPARSSVPIG
jgi:hypothetical protein